jgi:hypothetical protein
LQLRFFRPIGNVEETPPKNDGSDIAQVYHNTAGAFHDAKRTWQVFVPIGLRRFTSLLYDIVTGNRRSQDLLMHDTEYFRECLRTNVGDFTFQEAFDRTGRILNIVVTPKNSTDPPRLLNYLTAPHVLVWSAAVASSSLPGVFEANKLMVKDADGTERFESAAGTHFKDGSMEADLVSSDELSVWIKYVHCPVVYFCPRLYTHVVLLPCSSVCFNLCSLCNSCRRFSM